ncbi:hypothetical protein [Paucilactobacillus kaifaensis]|uniref:hypothetical protein n=1 Tax=Paucilactobacillus kaifaensis TaxID=2559921 RepID=UPI0010F74F70|nr:hypothetical protein [Paucilactobacillus kaifaensis]
MLIFLIVVAIISAVALITLFIKFVGLARSGKAVAHMKVWVTTSWVCLIVLVGSIGGAIFTATQIHSAESDKTKIVQHKKIADKKTAQAPKLSFSPSEPIIYVQSVPVKFTLSANTKFKIVGYYSKITYKEFSATGKSRTVAFDFDEAGYYELVATRGSKKLVKHITITKPAEASSSSNTQSTGD